MAIKAKATKQSGEASVPQESPATEGSVQQSDATKKEGGSFWQYWWIYIPVLAAGSSLLKEKFDPPPEPRIQLRRWYPRRRFLLPPLSLVE